LWVAATASDAEDGTVDGVSEFGALYRLGVVAGTAGLQVEEVCPSLLRRRIGIHADTLS
jgi:hypothetical protein